MDGESWQSTVGPMLLAIKRPDCRGTARFAEIGFMHLRSYPRAV